MENNHDIHIQASADADQSAIFSNMHPNWNSDLNKNAMNIVAESPQMKHIQKSPVSEVQQTLDQQKVLRLDLSTTAALLKAL